MGRAASAQVPPAVVLKLAGEAKPAPAPPTGAASAPATPASQPALTPAQAQAVLDVLQNDAKRTQFVAVLQNMARAQAAATPKAAGIPLTPGSLGAELIEAASAAVGRVSAELITTVRTLTDFQLLFLWLRHTTHNPDSMATLLRVGWTCLLLALVGGLAQFGAGRVLRRWRDGINRAAPTEDPANITPETGPDLPDVGPGSLETSGSGPDADTQRSRVRPAKPNNWTLLRRMPFVLVRLLIDLLPAAAFALAVYLLLATPLGSARAPRTVALGLLNAYLLVCVLMSVVRAILAPRTTSLRLLHMSDASAAYFTRWSRRFLVVAMFGYALDEIGLLFGMFDRLHEALVRVVALVLHAFALIVVFECRRRVARRLRAPATAHGPLAMMRNRLAEIWHLIAAFFIVALWLVFALEMRNGLIVMWRVFAIALLVLVAGRVASIVLVGALDRALHVRPETLMRYPGLDNQTRRYQGMLRALLNGAIAVVCVLVLMQATGVHVASLVRAGTLGARVATALATSALTVLLALSVWEVLNALVRAHLARLSDAGQLARSARLRTLWPMLRTTLMVVIFVFAALMVLSQIGVNTAPLLAGAGVVGIAIGFGSQKLVQDVITGLFLLLENAMQVGDTVTLANLSGTVENLSIRTIRLRAVDGAVHVIPFSAVTTVTNSNRDYGYAVLEVVAGYNEEPDHIAAVLREVAAEMRADENWHTAMEEDIDVQGVDRFVDNGWVLRARVKTEPSRRLAVQREFNRRMKYRFDLLAIESPFTSPRILSNVPPPRTAADPAPQTALLDPALDPAPETESGTAPTTAPQAEHSA